MTFSYIFLEWRRTAIEGKQPRDELDAGLEYKILKFVEFMVDPNLNLGSTIINLPLLTCMETLSFKPHSSNL